MVHFFKIRTIIHRCQLKPTDKISKKLFQTSEMENNSWLKIKFRSNQGKYQLNLMNRGEFILLTLIKDTSGSISSFHLKNDKSLSKHFFILKQTDVLVDISDRGGNFVFLFT